MGRFEQRPENPRIRGELSRAAENALWDVVEDLENLQQNLLRSLQEDVKRLEAEKNRLTTDIHQLIAQKEHLQQTKQITEQQVLIRQLAEVLAKHISSQLQSSLKILANQTLTNPKNESELSPEEITLKSVQVNHQINRHVSQMLDGLDDTVTIAFTSLQKELKNYQSNLSQQLSRMYEQQIQGEAILAEFVSNLQAELDKPKEINPLKVITGGAQTVLQLNEIHKNGALDKSSQRNSILSAPVITPELTQPSKPQNWAVLPTMGEIEAMSVFAWSPESATQPTPEELTEPISVLNPDLLAPETPTEPLSLEPENTTPPTSATNTELSPNAIAENASSISELPTELPTELPDVTPPIDPEITPSLKRKASQPSQASIQLGFFLVALSAVISSLYNVTIKAIFHQGGETLVGLEPTINNIFLVLMLRLLVVVPLMVLSAPILHFQVWQDLQNLFAPAKSKTMAEREKTKQVLLLSFMSGCFLFASQLLIYVAISQVATGVATSLFFIYPIVTVLISWFLLRDRPSLFITWAIAAIFCGELLMLGGNSSSMNYSQLGNITGVMSGIAFAGYVILTRLCATKLHPVTFTLINFITMLFLSFICMMLPLLDDTSLVINTKNLLEVVFSAFILGVLTLCGYLLNNFGIRLLGGIRASVIGSAVPILTVILAGLMLQENLDIVQVMGVLLVSIGAVAISFEKMHPSG